MKIYVTNSPLSDCLGWLRGSCLCAGCNRQDLLWGMLGEILTERLVILPTVFMVCVDAQSCLTLCKCVDFSLPGSSVHGISQARILDWVAISSSRGSSQPRDQTLISYISWICRPILYHSHHLKRPPCSHQLPE